MVSITINRNIKKFILNAKNWGKMEGLILDKHCTKGYLLLQGRWRRFCLWFYEFDGIVTDAPRLPLQVWSRERRADREDLTSVYKAIYCVLFWKSRTSKNSNTGGGCVGAISNPFNDVLNRYAQCNEREVWYYAICIVSRTQFNARPAKHSLQCRRILGGRNLVRVRNIVVAAIFDFMTVENWGE